MNRILLLGFMHTLTAAFCLLLVTVVGILLRGRVDITGSVHWSPSEHVYDSHLGWKGRPGFRNEKHIHAPVPFAIDVELNSDGFRDRDWGELLNRAASSERILLVGDSFIYGWGSLGRDTFSTIAQELADQAGRNSVFFNSGMSGYGFHHYLRVTQLYVEKIKPQQVWVMLTPNDVGDTALPYDHRYRQRVYKPYFDANGELKNSKVAKRPSLSFSDTPFGAWPGLIVLDELSYLLEDFQYYRSGLPTRYNSPLQIQMFDQLIWHRATLDKFPAIGQMIRRDIDDIVALSKAHGFILKFVNNASDSEFNRYFLERNEFYDPGDALVRELWPWLTHLNEGHPNFLWAALVAGRTLGLDRQHPAVERSISQRLASELSFASAADTMRALSGFHWGVEGDRVYLKRGGQGYLKLWIAPLLRAPARLILTIETRNALPAEAIGVSLFHRKCNLLDAPRDASRRFRFACDAKHLPISFVAPFEIDATVDAHFERVSLSDPD